MRERVLRGIDMNTFTVHNQAELEKVWKYIKGGDVIILMISEEMAQKKLAVEPDELPDETKRIEWSGCCC